MIGRVLDWLLGYTPPIPPHPPGEPFYRPGEKRGRLEKIKRGDPEKDPPTPKR
jgi:hypothetical protein